MAISHQAMKEHLISSSAKLKSFNKLQNTKSIMSKDENKLWQSHIKL